MSSTSPYVPFYASDWLAGTRGLTAVETGVYITLVALMYEADGPVPYDPRRLCRTCGCTPRTFEKAVDALMAQGKIALAEGGLTNARAKKEIEKRREKSCAAKKNAANRWRKSLKTQCADDADASRSQCGSDAYQNQSPELESRDIPSPPPLDDSARAPSSGSVVVATESPPTSPTLREKILVACGADPVSGLTGPNGTVLGTRADMHAVERWRADLGLDDETILAVIVDAMNRKRDGPPSRLSYFDRPMQREAGSRNRPKLEAVDARFPIPVHIPGPGPARQPAHAIAGGLPSGLVGVAMRRAAARRAEDAGEV